MLTVKVSLLFGLLVKFWLLLSDALLKRCLLFDTLRMELMVLPMGSATLAILLSRPTCLSKLSMLSMLGPRLP